MEIGSRYIHFIQTFKIMGSPHSLPLSCVDRNLSQKILTAWWEVQLHFDGGFNTIQIQFQMVSHFYRCFGLLNFCEKVVSSGCRNPSKVADNIQTPPSTSFWKFNNFLRILMRILVRNLSITNNIKWKKCIVNTQVGWIGKFSCFP